MPLTGAYAWKDADLSPEECIDRFFNLIDHAVEGGVPLADLYSREHVKNFLFYVLRRTAEPCKTRTSDYYKDLHMPKLNLTSTFVSSVIVGDPGIITVTLPPKETKSVDITEIQLRQLMPQLEKLKAANWLTFSISDAAEPAPAPAPPVVVVAAPAPVVVVEEVKVEAVPVPVPSPEPVPEPAAEPEAVVAAPEPVAPAAPAPSAPRPQSYDKKNRR